MAQGEQRVIHAQDDAEGEPSPEGRASSTETTCADSQRWARNPLRLEKHRFVARTVGIAASATAGQARVAMSLGISVRGLQRWTDPDGTQRMALADVLASRPDFARAVLTSALASIPDDARVAPRAPELHVVQLSAELGDVSRRLAEGLADGALTRDEKRAVARELQDVIERAQQFVRDLGDG